MGIRHVAVAFAAATALGTAHAQSTPVQDDWAMAQQVPITHRGAHERLGGVPG